MNTDFVKYRNLAKKLGKRIPRLVLLYVFGSAAENDRGPLSDLDFAVYLNEPDRSKRFEIRLKIMAEISLALKTDKVDVVVLNDTINPLLKYNALKNGILLYSRPPYKVIVEPKILSEYFDFEQSLARNKL